MKAVVLISCMHQDDTKIIYESNLHDDVVMVNQCDVAKEQIYNYPNGVVRIDTPTRGLSVSRNIAIDHADEDICIIADDDEVFVDKCQEWIVQQYKSIPDADFIIFKMTNQPCKINNKIHKLGYFELFRVSSWQITFRRRSVLENGIRFDPKLGSGTGNGGGEEIKYLIDAYKKGMKIYYVPMEIASVAQQESKWFFGFNDKFFYDRGCTTRYTFGFWISVFYAVYYVLSHRDMYRNDITMWKALKYTFKGIRDNKIARQK